MKKGLFLFLITMFVGCVNLDDPFLIRGTQIDFLVVRFSWSSNNGTDLDTRTTIISPERGVDVGWARAQTDQQFLTWGGDNTSIGFESILIDLAALKKVFAGQSVFKIKLRAFWYDSIADGMFKIEFSGYRRGAMVLSNFNFTNENGALVVSSNTQVKTNLQINADVDGDDIAILTYNVEDLSLEITPLTSI